MRSVINKMGAFIKRDFAIESGYQVSFLMGMFESLMLLVVFHFLGTLLNPATSSALGRYGNRYFPFAIIGVAFARYFDLMLKMFSDSIRQAQVTGCLEAMLSSQTGCVPIVLMSSLYGLIAGGIQLMLILVGGELIFGVDLKRMNVLATFSVLLVSIAIFVAFGVLSAAAIVWLKKGDPITWVLSGFASILGGAYFPIDIMPVWMQKVAFVVPITYSLDALRRTMLRGESLLTVGKSLLLLLVIAAMLLPASLAIFSGAVRKGRKEGTLMAY